jgi:hypothetical protein
VPPVSHPEPPWFCPVHGRVSVIACAAEGYRCTEDVSGRSETSTEPYAPCGQLVAGAPFST